METIHYLQQFATPWLDTFAMLITNLGSQYAYIFFLLFFYLLVDARKSRWLGIVLLLSLYVNFHLKGMIATQRPYLIDPAVARSDSAVATGTGYSFPSGHAQGIMTLWGLVALLFQRWWLSVLALLIIVLVASSRIYLGVHIPLDIYGGLAIGAIFVIAGYIIYVRTLNIERQMQTFFLFAVGIVIPLVLHITLPTPDSEVLLGALAAFISGPLLVRHRTDIALWRRVVIFLIGMVLVFALLLGSSYYLSDTLKDNPYIAFFRYLAIGWMGLLVTPALAHLTRLIPRAPKIAPKNTTVAAVARGIEKPRARVNTKYVAGGRGQLQFIGDTSDDDEDDDAAPTKTEAKTEA